jgi:hypothetical protein
MSYLSYISYIPKKWARIAQPVWWPRYRLVAHIVRSHCNRPHADNLPIYSRTRTAWPWRWKHWNPGDLKREQVRCENLRPRNMNVQPLDFRFNNLYSTSAHTQYNYVYRVFFSVVDSRRLLWALRYQGTHMVLPLTHTHDGLQVTATTIGYCRYAIE